MKENKYFKESEFKCKCGKCELPPKMPPDELIDILCEIREHFNAPLIINSGYRCKEHNAKIGGAKASRHTFGDAVDFRVKGEQTIKVYEYVLAKYDEQPFGIAKKINHQNAFGGFVHLDTRGLTNPQLKKARWDYK